MPVGKPVHGGGRSSHRSHPDFHTRAATDDAAQLSRRLSLAPTTEDEVPRQSDVSSNSYERRDEASEPASRCHSFTRKMLGAFDGSTSPLNGGGKPGASLLNDSSLTAQMHSKGDSQDKGASMNSRPGAMPRPVGGSAKLGTFSGVFVPTSLNVLSILMFLRFGFILGQSGALGMMGMLIASYLINLVTTLSLSAIATNGTVRGGGAYYLISRSLGPEFGGSIGVVFYLGFVFNTGLNAVGLIDCLRQNFGSESGDWGRWLTEGFWWQYLWASIILLLCTAICLAGSGIFARCSNGLLVLLLVATFSIPLSALFKRPYSDPGLGIEYTGLSAATFRSNLLPKFTSNAAGSQLQGRENFQDLFGILFPATGGIFAGASMSGDLKHPSKAIPKGTLAGLALTFFAYTVVILAMAATITRNTLYNNVNIIQDVNLSAVLILLGEMASTLFSSLMGVVGSAKLLQALARDSLLPGFSVFGQGTKANDEPTYAILITYVVAQITILCDINQIATFVTMTYLMTFLVTNLACFLLKISSAPNFRPSFHFFNWYTAAFGTLISGASMFFVDRLSASACVVVLVVIFLIIHYTTPPKSWGDVSQSLIYHQVRKYLLRLRQEHVKFWRPQILLFVNDPRRSYKLIQFCNSLKKGALFVLGHVIISQDFGTSVPEARRQQKSWTEYIDFSRIKAFVNIAVSPAIEWGTRNIVLSAGLGGMRPNIVVMGFYNLEAFQNAQPLVDVRSPQPSRSYSRRRRPLSKSSSRSDSKAEELRGELPTDTCRPEGDVGPSNYVTILEDLLLRLQINVAIAKGFHNLEFPQGKRERTKRYIDLWPIQMSAEIASEDGTEKQNLLTTNFDTYTLILQLGCILLTVPRWKKAYKLRVAVFVEYESDVEEERGRVRTLLDNLRIQAEVLVFWLASGHVKTYQAIVNGDFVAAGKEVEKEVEDALKDEDWWQDIQRLRGRRGRPKPSDDLADARNMPNAASGCPGSSFRSRSRQGSITEHFGGLKKAMRRVNMQQTSKSVGKRRSSIGMATSVPRMSMTTTRLHDDLVNKHASHASASEDSSSSGDDEASSSEDGSDQDVLSQTGSTAEEGAAQWNEYFLAGVNPDSHKQANDADEDGSPSALQPTKARRARSDPEVPQVYSQASPKATPSSPGPMPANKASHSVEDDFDRSATGARSPDLGIAPLRARPPAPSRPRNLRRSSTAKFSSLPVPRTKVAAEDGPGPSIMFTESSERTESHPHRSIYQRSASASGFPGQQSVPLSFNDLPCRAQHLILNELMRSQSGKTAVLFTTLPSPEEGTGKSDDDSLNYLSDLEVLCEGLPPLLLVHSNSITVTMSL